MAPAETEQPIDLDFPRQEFQERYRRAKELMAREGLDALLVTSQRNYIYFTGHTATGTLPYWLWTLSEARPFIAVLPREGEPFMVIHIIGQNLARGCWIDRRKVWADEPFRASYFTDALKEFGLTQGTIGCEFGEEQRFGLPLAEFFAVQKAMPGLKWTDASRLLWDLRALKSRAEVERMREANRITVSTADLFIEQARTGMTARDAGNLLQRLALEHGADYLPLCLFTVTGPNGRAQYPPAIDRPFQNGDLLYLDTGAQHKGYSADVNRMIFFGKPPKAIYDNFEAVANLQRFLIAQIRPGAVLSEVRAALDEEYRRQGLPLRPIRAGHGIGMQPTEAPSINAASTVVLRPGMTITAEPSFVTPDGYQFTVEHDLLVTADGSDNLTDAPLELSVVPR